MKVNLDPVTEATMGVYITVGKRSYCQHYLHLWPNQDPTPYLSRSFTPEVVQSEINDVNNAHFLVVAGNQNVGIVKLVLNKNFDGYDPSEALLAEKIYLLKEHTGKGAGQKVLESIMGKAKHLRKKVVWLDTMKKGSALDFYLQNGFSIVKESSLQLPGAIDSERPMWILARRV